jgi:hypothetical protein
MNPNINVPVFDYCGTYCCFRFDHDQNAAIKKLQDLVRDLQSQQNSNESALLAAVEKLVRFHPLIVADFFEMYLALPLSIAQQCFFFFFS